MILNNLAKYSMTQSITRPLCYSRATCCKGVGAGGWSNVRNEESRMDWAIYFYRCSEFLDQWLSIGGYTLCAASSTVAYLWGPIVRPPPPLCSDRKFFGLILALFCNLVTWLNRKIRAPSFQVTVGVFCLLKTASKRTDLLFLGQKWFFSAEMPSPVLHTLSISALRSLAPLLKS